MYKLAALIAILLLGIFLRSFKLMDFPVQLNHDEITQLYDAVSVAETGRDIYGNFLPFIFPSVQDFKPPFYTYATSLVYFIFGNQEWIIKIPGLVFSSLLIPAVYLFTSRIFNANVGLLGAFMTAISPFEIFYGRKSFENSAGIFFMLIGFYFLMRFLDSRGGKFGYAGLTFLGVGMYTYFSHAVLLPLMLLGFGILYRRQILSIYKSAERRSLIFGILSFLIIIAPLEYFILTDPNSGNRAKAVVITQDIALGRFVDYANLSNLWIDFVNRKLLIFYYSFNRYLEQFNPIYIFGIGLDLTNQGIVNMGLLYFIQLPFLFLGVAYLIKYVYPKPDFYFLLLMVALGMIPSGLTFEGYSPHRSIVVFTIFNIVSAAGIYYFKNLMWKNAKPIFAYVFIGMSFAVNFIYFSHVYFINYPREKSHLIHYPFREVAIFAKEHYLDYDKIIFDPLFGEHSPVVGTAAHYYLGYYGGITPLQMQNELKTGDAEREMLFGKYSIRKVKWEEVNQMKNVLIIASSWSMPVNSIEKEKVVKVFNFYNGQPAFYAVSLR